MKVIKPEGIEGEMQLRLTDKDKITVFLAGSIEGDKAEKWQDKFVEEFKDLNITFLNPRRDAWDNSWVQDKANPQFNHQVNWELSGLDIADYVIFYFDPKTLSPITLLELGTCVTHPKVFVCCPDGYWKKGNVEITCEYHGIPFYHTWDEFIKHLKVIWDEKLDNERHLNIKKFRL